MQAFEGMVLSQKHGNEPGATITVRKVTKGVGVERIFPIFSPIIDKIEITKRGNVRKSKLYYIREKVNKEIRRQLRKSKLVDLSTISEVETKKKAEQKKKEREKEEKEIKKNENIETNNLEKVNIEDEKKDDKKTETEEKIK
ncbi:MAG: 50S ribosomal protein L19 [Candidatus Pacebacteria bacterium]|nr:50S ribosomal protein L19 [Candidatus Paceibacterota bacterium]